MRVHRLVGWYKRSSMLCFLLSILVNICVYGNFSRVLSDCLHDEDLFPELCSSNQHLCEDFNTTSLNVTSLIRASCPTTCGICSDQDTRHSPENNETLFLRFGIVHRCEFVFSRELGSAFLLWANITAAPEGPLSVFPRITTSEGYVQLVPVVESECPLEGNTELTCEQVWQAASRLVSKDPGLNLALIFNDCPEAAASVYDSAQIVQIDMNPYSTTALTLPWSRYRFTLRFDQDDYIMLIRQAEVEGIQRVGIAHLQELYQRHAIVRHQLDAYSVRDQMSVVYEHQYSQFSGDTSFSSSLEEYIQAFNITEWDAMLYGMQRAGVEWLICISHSERISIMNRIAELKMYFKAITFDKSADEMSRLLGSKAEFTTSTLEYHHAMESVDDIFGSNIEFVALFERMFARKPRFWEALTSVFLSMVYHAVREYDSFASEDIINAFLFMDINTILGPIKISAGNVMLEMSSITLQHQNSTLETVLPASVASSTMIPTIPSWECRSLLHLSDPSICTDAQYSVWRDCVREYSVIRDSFNATACQNRLTLDASQKDGNSLRSVPDRSFYIWLVVACVGVLLLFLLFGCYGYKLYKHKTRQLSVWIPLDQVQFLKESNGNQVVLAHNVNKKPIVGGVFQSNQVVIKIVIPADISTKTKIYPTKIHPTNEKFSATSSSTRYTMQTQSEDSVIEITPEDVLDQSESCFDSTDEIPMGNGVKSVHLSEHDKRDSDQSETTSVGKRLHENARRGMMSKIAEELHSSFNVKHSHSRRRLLKSKDFEIEVATLQSFQSPYILRVCGAIEDTHKNICLVTERMDAGSLWDVISTGTAFDTSSAVQILSNVAEAVTALHKCSPPVIHGGLSSSQVFLDHNFVAKVGGFGLNKTLACEVEALLCPPELISFTESGDLVPVHRSGLVDPKIDVYIFAFLCCEVFSFQMPFQQQMSAMIPKKDVIRAILEEDLRPPIPKDIPSKLVELIQECWQKNAAQRPCMKQVLVRLQNIAKMERAKSHSEYKKNVQNTKLLHQVLPPRVAEALSQGKKVKPEEHSNVAVFFSDVVGFTEIGAKLDPQSVMLMLDRLYTKFDIHCSKWGLFKVETIGDAYMCVGGIPDQLPDQTVRVALFAMAAIRAAQSVPVSDTHPDLGTVNIRVGVHCGSVIASVVGELNPRYCLFGDTVNTASRMESNSESGQVNLSPSANAQLHVEAIGVQTHSRGTVHVKGKGPLQCFFLDQSKASYEALVAAVLPYSPITSTNSVVMDAQNWKPGVNRSNFSLTSRWL